AHFRTWQQLIGVAVTPANDPTPPPTPSLRDLFTLDARRQLVSLRELPGGALPYADAAVLLLHGFQQFVSSGRPVPVTRLKAALAASGYPDARIDRSLWRHVGAGLIVKRGRRIGSVYQLTATGSQRADALVQRFTRQPAKAE